ncbi:MAG: histidine phosphatase family protein [Dehalococcoidales bacterium]|nr:histidine phosphatase family protein [Dehalococcoidales bacterium]
MTEIILARHGQTAWNIGEVFRGQTDIPLDETGLRQAELLAKYLSDRKVEAIYSSPLQRALKTARAIARYQQLEVKVSEKLNDLSFGEWEGMPHEEVKEKYKELYEAWIAKPNLVKLPGGESLDDLTRRAFAFVNEVINQYQGTVVLVAHRVVNQALILAMLGLDNSHFWNIRLDTAATTIFTYQHCRYILVEHNNTSYLK